MSGSPLHPSSSLLLSALSDAVGQAIVLDEDGQCGLEFDDAIEVIVAQTVEPGILSLRTPVTDPGDPLDAERLQLALSLNYMVLPPGYAIALDAASRQLMLLALVDADAISRDDFLRRAAGLLDLAPDVRERLAPSVRGAGPFTLN